MSVLKLTAIVFENMPVLIQSDIFVEFLTNGETATQIQEIFQLIRDGEIQACVI